MAYTERLVIPVNTTEASPASVAIPIIPITVKRVEITFPSGCVGLVGVWFEYQDRQIWPNNPEARYRGNDQAIHFSPGLELLEPPFLLTVLGINEDDTFPHTVYIVVDAELPGGFLGGVFGRIFSGGAPVALGGRS